MANWLLIYRGRIHNTFWLNVKLLLGFLVFFGCSHSELWDHHIIKYLPKYSVSDGFSKPGNISLHEGAAWIVNTPTHLC